MGLTPQYQAALEMYAEEFLVIVPVDEIINRLRFKNIISSRQKDDILSLTHKEDKNNKLIEILLTLNNEDIRKFCNLLKENGVNAVKQFAAKLLSECDGTLPDVDIFGNPSGNQGSAEGRIAGGQDVVDRT